MVHPVKTTLSHEEITALTFKADIFGIRRNSQGEETLVHFSKREYTVWNRILSCFGKGILAHTHTSLKEVITYLNKFNWQEEKNENYSSYLTVCALANKALINGTFKKNVSAYDTESPSTLFDNVGISTKINIKEKKYSENFSNCTKTLITKEKSFQWNPELKVIHLQQIFQQDHEALFYIWNKNTDEFLSSDSSIQENQLQNLKIRVFSDEASATAYFQ